MTRRFFALILLLAGLSTTNKVHAQAIPTATRGVQLSAFGGVAGVDTGLTGARNLSFVIGADIGLRPVHGMQPVIEVRGLYPIDGGNVAAQKSILFGPRVDFMLKHRLHPYGDFLFGRGQIDYKDGGYLYFNSIYLQTTTNVFSPGGGVDYELSPHLSIKADAQYQHWGYTPTPSGSVWSKVGTVGIVYRFSFGPRRLP